MRQQTFLERHIIRSVVGRCATASSLAATLVIKRSLMATVSCLALTGAAAAADIPARVPMKAPLPPVVSQIWAGPYIGLNGGAVWHRMAVDTTEVGVPYDSTRTRQTGGTFGGQVGYNWQSQNFVYGLEADANWVSSRGSESRRPVSSLVLYETRLSWLATARARAGVAFGRTLVYGTGGLAVGGVENNWGSTTATAIAYSDTRVGWTAGGGIEHFISNPHITVKAEALYVDLGRTTVVETSGTGYTSRFKNTAIVGRLGLNLKW
jgi:outer membrane immunogenic protein